MSHYERIIREISPYLHTYLKAGHVSIDSFSRKIHDDINQFERLFIVRFLLQKETKEFVENLPVLLRHFKTTTISRKQESIAEIRGAIDWPETVRKRINENYRDKLTFVTDESMRSYVTPENIVLKQLLQLLYDHLYENNYIQTFYNQSWFSEWKSLRNYVQSALKHNVYLQRVTTASLSERMIQHTMKHRNPLYRKAANLLHTYNRFMKKQFTEKELQQLLRETFILPQKEDVLFELYWIIQLMRNNTEESTLHLMDGSNHILASWTDKDYQYSIYHDSSGPRTISFQTHIDELKGANKLYVKQVYNSFLMAENYGHQLFGRKKTNIYRQGRPDIIVIKQDIVNNKIVEIIIGEVKNTKNVDYAMTGLRELLDYIHLIKFDGTYVDKDVQVRGLLCVQSLSRLNGQDEKNFIQVVTLDDMSGLWL